MLVMFFIERFFSYHHHDVPDELDHDHDHGSHHGHDHDHDHEQHPHDMSWSGAALGLALHSVLNGVALAAAVQHGSHGSWLAGFGTFLVIVSAQAVRRHDDQHADGPRRLEPGLAAYDQRFVFAVHPDRRTDLLFRSDDRIDRPRRRDTQQWYIACALAFSAGTFLCISLSDLLPELQFHSHDRLKLSAALLLGLAVAHFAARMEALAHPSHAPPPAVTTQKTT